jgi:TRAP-type C4-dicarboxylate transport system substrate-binding protein
MFGRTTILLAIAGLLAVVIPGSSEPVRAQQGGEIKISMLAPRESPLFAIFKKLSAKIDKVTNGAWKMRIYPFGVAGDEKDVVRKMEIGQMDGALVTTTGLSVIEPQIAILDTPGLIMSYKDLESIEGVMNNEIPAILQKKKIKVLTTWEAGQYRVFHKAGDNLIRYPADLKKHREWLWPENYILKEWWREAGSTGVPLAVMDVYPSLQTRMIDTVVATASVVVQMRWHTGMDHVSERAQGVLLFFWVMNQSKWDAIPAHVQKAITEDLQSIRREARAAARKSDDEAYNTLLKRGYTPVKLSPAEDAAWTDLFGRVNKKLTGRLWPASLYSKLDTLIKNGR